MPQVDMFPIPKTYNATAIASADSNAITIGSEIAGKRVRVWGFVLAGADAATMQFLDDATPLSGAMPTGGLQQMPLPRGNPDFDQGVPAYQSSPGKTIKIKPSASGLNGTVYWTQE